MTQKLLFSPSPLEDSKLIYFSAWDFFQHFSQFLVSDIWGKHIHLSTWKDEALTVLMPKRKMKAKGEAEDFDAD